MEFGITSRNLKRVAIIGGMMGAALGTMFLTVGVYHGTIRSWGGVLWAVSYGFATGAILPAGVFLTSILRLRVDGDEIVQTLFGIGELSSRNISELAAITLNGRLFPVVLSFRGGGTMRLFGIHLGEISSLVDYLVQRAPDCIVED